MFRSPKGAVTSRRVRGAEEGAVLDGLGAGGRVRTPRERRCCTGRDAAERGAGSWVGRRQQEASSRNVARPAAQRRPADDGCVADDRRRADAPPHVRRRRADQAPEREGEADRGGAVYAPAAHLTWHDEDHGAAGDATVAAGEDGDALGRLCRPAGAAYLTLAGAVALELDRAADGTAGSAAGWAPRGARFGDAGRVLLPALDVDGALDDTATASILRHWNRSTTRRLSAKIRSPRRLFVAGTAPMLRPPAAPLRDRRP